MPHDLQAPDLAFAGAFSAGLLRPERETPALVTGRPGGTATARYNVYRNNVTASLVDALAAIYPAVQRIVGVDFFRAMARAHVRQTPPTSPLLFEYGYDFPAFIARHEAAAQAPWLADVARIERAWLDAYHAADVAPLAPAELAAIAPERLADIVFTPHPAARLTRSRFSAVAIFVANRAPGPVAEIDASGPEDALVTRPDGEVIVRRLAPGQAELLAALLAGRSLGEAAGMAVEACPDVDIGAGLAVLIESGACASARLGENQ